MIEVIYDGACPVCRRSVQRLKQRAGGPPIALIDARAAPDRVAELSARGLDVDEGIVVKAGDSYLSGAEATRFLAGLHVSSRRLERLVAWCFVSPRRDAPQSGGLLCRLPGQNAPPAKARNERRYVRGVRSESVAESGLQFSVLAARLEHVHCEQ